MFGLHCRRLSSSQTSQEVSKSPRLEIAAGRWTMLAIGRSVAHRDRYRVVWLNEAMLVDLSVCCCVVCRSGRERMLIKEYRIPLPLTLEEYSIAQLYMIQVYSYTLLCFVCVILLYCAVGLH